MLFRAVIWEWGTFRTARSLSRNEKKFRVRGGIADVTAVVTAMTDGERPHLPACLNAIIADPGIARVLLCVQDSNTWIDEMLKSVGPDSRIEVLRMSMDPAGAVRNEAVKHVETEWIAFCDGDDVWCEGKTAIQRHHADEQNADFVGGDHYLTDEAGRVRAVALAKYLPMTSTWMVRTSIMQQYPFKWEKKFNGIEDHQWWFDTMNVIKKDRCPRLLLKYRVRGFSLSSFEPSKARKARVVSFASKPVIGWAVFILTGCLWLVNRSKSYRPLLK